MDSISYIYISWTIHDIWMIYIKFERGVSKFSITIDRALERSPSSQPCSSVRWEQNGYYAAQDFFCFREFITIESATAVQRAFRLRFNIQPLTRKNICRWNHQFEQIGCLFKGKSSGRPRVSEENVRRIQESFERSPRKSTLRASRELGIPQPTVWRVLRRRLLFNWVHLFESPCTMTSLCAGPLENGNYVNESTLRQSYFSYPRINSDPGLLLAPRQRSPDTFSYDDAV